MGQKASAVALAYGVSMSNESPPDISLSFSPETLRPLVRTVVAEALGQLKAADPSSDRIAYDEREAAERLGLERHVLRDERYRGRITAYKVAGGRVRYRREDLLAYLLARPWQPNGNRRSSPENTSTK